MLPDKHKAMFVNNFKCKSTQSRTFLVMEIITKICLAACSRAGDRVFGHHDLQGSGLRAEGERGEGAQSSSGAAHRHHDQHG